MNNIYTKLIDFRLEQSIQEGDAWGEHEDDNEYYNDNPNAQPPSPKQPKKTVPSEYSFPPSNLPVSYPPSFLCHMHRVHLRVVCPSVTVVYVYTRE